MTIISYSLKCILTAFESFVGFSLVVISIVIFVKLSRNKKVPSAKKKPERY